MRRREFIASVGAAVAAGSVGARAQPRQKPIVGWLGGSTRQVASRNLNAFLKGLNDLGHEDGNDIKIVYRWANGDLARHPELARELIAFQPKVVVAVVNAAIIAVQQASALTPVVGPLLFDPVGYGFADAYNRPGRNVTGVLQSVDTLPAKQVELLLAVSPRTKTVGVLLNPDAPEPNRAFIIRNLEAALRGSPVKLVSAQARRADDLAPAFQQLQERGADGLIVPQDALFFTEEARINKLAADTRLPAMYSFRQNVERGGLMSYAVDIPQNFYRAAYFVDRILKGTPPADLPIELPVKLELVINLKTAKALGLEIPSKLLFTADAVIE